MPAFELELGTGEAWFNSRDEVVQGYVEAMLFTASDDVEGATVGDLSTEARERICADCMAFQATYEFRDAWNNSGNGYEFDREQAGRDFWFTRNGHGVGFWDREPHVYGSHAVTLDSAADRFGTVDLYRGADGKLYLS